MTEGARFETVGERLRRLRLERNLSQRELSGPGVSYAYISRIEAGTRQPSVKALRVLARKLGVSPELLETGSDLDIADLRELRLADAELDLRLGLDQGAAAGRLATILEEAAAAGDSNAAMRAQVALGVAAHNRGDHPEAIVRLESVVDAGYVSPLTEPDVFAVLGRSYLDVGTPERAVELFESCLAEVQQGDSGNAALWLRFSVDLSYALSGLGDLARAQDVVLDAVRQAPEEVDAYARVRLYWSVGRLSDLRGHATTALTYFRKAIALLEVTEDSINLARAHANCAEVLINQGKALQAGRHLESALSIYGPTVAPADLGFVRVQEARRTLQLGRPEESIELATTALELLGRDFPVFRAGAYAALGEARASLRDGAGVAEAFRSAADLYEDQAQWRDAAQVCRMWGKFLRGSGREHEALDVLERASDLAVRMQVDFEARVER